MKLSVLNSENWRLRLTAESPWDLILLGKLAMKLGEDPHAGDSSDGWEMACNLEDLIEEAAK
jgi:hypothetical protein